MWDILFTILGVVALIFVVRWLDRKVFNKGRFGND